MKYSTKDKFKVKTKSVDVDVVGCFPGGQLNKIDTKGSNYYRVVINGYESYMSEKILSMLVEEN